MMADKTINLFSGFPGYEEVSSNIYSHMKSEGCFKSYGSDRPDLMRPKAQGRNERCNCGSGKKYKYCCGK